jgi:hypothetical protein
MNDALSAAATPAAVPAAVLNFKALELANERLDRRRRPAGRKRDRRWPLAPTDLLPRERWLWWKQLRSDVCALRVRYRLPVRSGWWEDQAQVEALAALAA